jgi:peptide/nickel transport system permease protein
MQAIPLGLAVTFLTFLLVELAPGDFLAQQKLNPLIAPETLDRLSRDFGLDQPLLGRYLNWLGRLFHGDLGLSFSYRLPVLDLVAERAGATLLLSFLSLLASWCLALPLGILGARKPGGKLDVILSGAAILALSVPSFFLALLLVWAAVVTGWLPTGGLTSASFSGMTGLEKAGDLLRHLAIPVTVLSLSGAASLYRVTRSQMILAQKEPFILAARARGLSERAILIRHAFRAALGPLITLLGYELASLLSGAALTEVVCSYPGLGRLVLEALLAQDLFLVAGATLGGFVLLMAGNLAADILMAFHDPRLRFGEGRS